MSTSSCNPFFPIANRVDVTGPESSSQKIVPLKCIYFNARSIRNKLSSLNFLLEFQSPDILILSETWLTEDDSDSLLSFHSAYTVHRCDRVLGSAGEGGGLLFLPKIIFRSLSINPNHLFHAVNCC